ncbi:MAG: hypothetical protein WCS52_05630 [bacterium]
MKSKLNENEGGQKYNTQPSPTAKWDAISEKLQGFGPEERSVDTSACTWRVKLPELYLDKEIGFAELLNEQWLLTYRDENFLVAIPAALSREYLDGLHHELCDSGLVSLDTFKKLHETLIYRLKLDCRFRWNINEHLQRHLAGDTKGGCRVTFQTRGATIEIRTLGRYCQELARAHAEMCSVKAGINPRLSQ